MVGNFSRSPPKKYTMNTTCCLEHLSGKQQLDLSGNQSADSMMNISREFTWNGSSFSGVWAQGETCWDEGHTLWKSTLEEVHMLEILPKISGWPVSSRSWPDGDDRDGCIVVVGDDIFPCSFIYFRTQWVGIDSPRILRKNDWFMLRFHVGERRGKQGNVLPEVLRLFQDLQDLLQEPSVIAFSTLAILIKVDVLMNFNLH